MKKVDFMGRKKLWFIISTVVITIGLVSLVIQGLNLGIDFTGGTLFHLQFEQPVTSDQVKEVIADHDLTNIVPKLSEGNVVIVRTETIPQEKRDQILDDFKTKLGGFEEIGGQRVEPFVGQELKRQALLGILLAGVGMVVYITIRFEFKFAISAIIALLHDVLIVLGVFSLLKLEINVSFVAAVLTVVGYSINDTIVVFDRIRENSAGQRKIIYNDLINKSINETLSRTVNTSLTTLFMVVALLFFGGSTIRDFMFALFIGIVSGTYSSIFIASPLWAVLKNRKVVSEA
jgi:preprotein translocase subunit SecF